MTSEKMTSRLFALDKVKLLLTLTILSMNRYNEAEELTHAIYLNLEDSTCKNILLTFIKVG